MPIVKHPAQAFRSVDRGVELICEITHLAVQIEILISKHFIFSSVLSSSIAWLHADVQIHKNLVGMVPRHSYFRHSFYFRRSLDLLLCRRKELPLQKIGDIKMFKTCTIVRDCRTLLWRWEISIERNFCVGHVQLFRALNDVPNELSSDDVDHTRALEKLDKRTRQRYQHRVHPVAAAL